MAPNPIEDQRQLSLTIYRMAHGCWFKVLTGMFWVSQSLATETFNNVVKCMVFTLYDEFVCLPRTEVDLANECKGFIENYEFPCDEAWNGFYLHLCPLSFEELLQF